MFDFKCNFSKQSQPTFRKFNINLKVLGFKMATVMLIIGYINVKKGYFEMKK